MNCKICNKRAYSEYCMQHKPRKRIKQMGRRGMEYKEWRDNVAIPYLDTTFGRKCSVEGCKNTNLDVDHILKRGSHPELKMDLSNVRYLCRTHHREVT